MKLMHGTWDVHFLEPSCPPPLPVITENVLSDVNKINYEVKLPVSKASFCAISKQKGL